MQWFPNLLASEPTKKKISLYSHLSLQHNVEMPLWHFPRRRERDVVLLENSCLPLPLEVFSPSLLFPQVYTALFHCHFCMRIDSPSHIGKLTFKLHL